MWWVDLWWGDELFTKYAGPFSTECQAEDYAMMITGDSSDYTVYQDETSKEGDH